MFGAGGPFFSRLLKLTVLDQPTVNNGRVSRGRPVAVTVGCWLLAVGTSMALQWHFNGTFTALQRNLNNTSMSHKKMPHNFLVFVFFVVADVDNFFWEFTILLLDIKCG